jgi:hypothetical protein
MPAAACATVVTGAATSAKSSSAKFSSIPSPFRAKSAASGQSAKGNTDHQC